VRKAYVVGGESVVSAAVVSDLAAMDVEAFRVAGADRVLTSIEAMSAGKDAGSASTSVVIASEIISKTDKMARSIFRYCLNVRLFIIILKVKNPL
jgi:putative cell wall-binding protein